MSATAAVGWEKVRELKKKFKLLSGRQEEPEGEAPVAPANGKREYVWHPVFICATWCVFFFCACRCVCCFVLVGSWRKAVLVGWTLVHSGDSSRFQLTLVHYHDIDSLCWNLLESPENWRKCASNSKSSLAKTAPLQAFSRRQCTVDVVCCSLSRSRCTRVCARVRHCFSVVAFLALFLSHS